MATDNEFDEFLKQNLWRDLVFRALIWIGISMATAVVAIYGQGVEPEEFVNRVVQTLSPLATSIGVFSLLLCGLALMLKDLQATLEVPRLKAATRGKLGGFVRRLAGDLSLWTLGAFITLQSAFAIALFAVKMEPNDYITVGAVAVPLVVITTVIAVANILVRRAGPTLIVSTVKKPSVILLVYLSALAITAARSLFRVM